MKKTRYTIRNKDGSEEIADGYTFELEGLKLGCCKEHSDFNSFSRWRFTELQSGYVFLIGEWNKSRKSCLTKIQERIKIYGMPDIRKRIVEACLWAEADKSESKVENEV